MLPQAYLHQLKPIFAPIKLICTLSIQISAPSNSFGPFQINLRPFRPIFAISNLFAPSKTNFRPLNLFPTSQNKYSPPYTNLCLIKLICTLLNKFTPPLKLIGTLLNQFSPPQTYLHPLQTDLCHFVFPNNRFGPTSNQSVSLPLI